MPWPPVPWPMYYPPDTLKHGRAYSSDEDGDGPSGARIIFMHVEEEEAEVKPICEICGTSCRIYAYCRFCRLGPIMHHGRCCLANPGRLVQVPNQVILAIQRSGPLDVIRVMGITMDYIPLVEELCKAKTAATDRVVEVILDRAGWESGHRYWCMIMDLVEAGVRVCLPRSTRPVQVCFPSQFGSLMGDPQAKTIIIGKHAFVGNKNWIVSSRTSLEVSVHLKLDVDTAGEINMFFTVVWIDAEEVTKSFLLQSLFHGYADSESCGQTCAWN